MKITNAPEGYNRQAYIQETADHRKLDVKEQPVDSKKEATNSSDVVVTLSETSKETSKDLKIAKDAVANTPDVRTEKVEELKAAVHQGTYEIKADQIAEKMVGTLISNIV